MAHYSAHTVIHHAGAWIGNKQVCDRCGELLADNPDGPSKTGKRMPYPEGALILSTRTYRVMTLTDRLPTCTPSPEAQAGATEANADADVVTEGVKLSSPTGAPMEFEDRYHEYYGYPSEVDLED